MPYSLDLSSSRAKLERAKYHVYAYRAAVTKKLGPHPIYYPLSRQFEPQQGAVVYRIERSIEVGDDWSLIVADAVHSFRCALDHLAWQLAIRHFNGVEASAENVAGEIQFPIVESASEWVPTKRYRRYIVLTDAVKLEQYQPFHIDPQAQHLGLPHPLVMLRLLSNTDKHRKVQLLYETPATFRCRKDVGVDTVRDCEVTGGISFGSFILSPKVGDIIVRVPVRVTGPQPDVSLDPEVAIRIAFREHWNVDDVLTTIQEYVERILRLF